MHESYKSAVVMREFSITLPRNHGEILIKPGTILTVIGAVQWYAHPEQQYSLCLLDENGIPVPVPTEFLLIVNQDRSNFPQA